jgi:hypothetical protein
MAPEIEVLKENFKEKSLIRLVSMAISLFSWKMILKLIDGSKSARLKIHQWLVDDDDYYVIYNTIGLSYNV